MNDRLGLPIQRFFHGIAPGAITPPPLGQPAAHHQIEPLPELLHEAFDPGEIVAAVRIAHDDPFPAGRFNARAQGAAIALFLYGDDPRPRLSGDGRRPVGAPVVGDQHFPAQPRPLQAGARLFNAASQRFRLVEARHQDRQLTFVLHTQGAGWIESGIDTAKR